MRTRRGGIVPVLCLLLAAAPSYADAADAAREQQLEARRAQLRQKWERQFRAADADQSRSLTPAEAEEARLPRSLLRRFAEIDTDGDGALSPEELLAAQQERLQAAGVATSEPAAQ